MCAGVHNTQSKYVFETRRALLKALFDNLLLKRGLTVWTILDV